MAVNQNPEIAARHARKAGLHYVYDQDPGITRKKKGKGFAYYTVQGKIISDPKKIARCEKLAVPPAWTNVWISPNPKGHIQATGLDSRGRKQYRYHPDWRTERDRAKFKNMAYFGAALPSIRRNVSQSLNQDGLTADRVIAAIVRLLDCTGLRVGNDSYLAENHTCGLTTISKKHIELHGREIELDFPGKGGKIWHGTVLAPKVAKVISACEDIPGYRLFKYRDDAGCTHTVSSAEVNQWLQTTTNDSETTAKDFRTWHACVLFAEEALKDDDAPLKTILKTVSQQLGNTPAILQKSYVHPNLIDLYRQKKFRTGIWRKKSRETVPANLHKTEALLLRWLEKQYGGKH